MERVDTIYQRNRIYIRSEVKQLRLDSHTLQYNPYKPGDSISLRGGRFLTTIRNVDNKVEITTRFNGIDTTFITAKTVYKIPNVWIDKYNNSAAELLREKLRYWRTVVPLGGLCAVLGIAVFLLARGRFSVTSILGSLLP
jgi:hypothetical protein